MALFNVAEETFAAFTKLIGPLLLIFVIIGIIYWLRTLQRGRHTDIVVVRGPGK